VGQGPHEVAISTDGRWAVVTNYGVQGTAGNTLSVIDLAAETPSVVRTIDHPKYQRPHGAAFVQSGMKLLVTSETSQRLLLLDFISGRIDTAMATNGRGSHMVTVQRDGRRAWTSNIADGTVTEFDVDTRTSKRTFAVAANVEGISATPGGVQVWVGSNTAKSVTVVNGADAKILGTITGFGQPYRVGVSRTGRVALVSDPPSNRIWIYDVGTRKELAQIDLAGQTGVGSPAAQAGPEGITFDPIADYAYVTLHGTNQVVAIDLRSRKVMGFGSVGAGPDGIGFSPYVRR
jgi:DNA-binding beta-propeller fold protein YncE